MRKNRAFREAHFAVAVLVVDGEEWVAQYGVLNVYHHGPNFDDAGAATWEVTFTPAEERRLQLPVGQECEVDVQTPDGRRFSGTAMVQHASSSTYTLLDTAGHLRGITTDDLS